MYEEKIFKERGPKYEIISYRELSSSLCVLLTKLALPLWFERPDLGDLDLLASFCIRKLVNLASILPLSSPFLLHLLNTKSF